jgi:HPr kinase/phosphorylase
LGDGAETHHGTAIAIGGAAALILGKSGSGKSDLALRCLACGPSPLIPDVAVLVADDRVYIDRAGSRLEVSCPETIAGKLEVRGVGIVAVPFRRRADLVLGVELAPPGNIERLPDPAPELNFLGVAVPLLRLAPFEASAAPKVLLALMQAAHSHHKPLEP